MHNSSFKPTKKQLQMAGRLEHCIVQCALEMSTALDVWSENRESREILRQVVDDALKIDDKVFSELRMTMHKLIDWKGLDHVDLR